MAAFGSESRIGTYSPDTDTVKEWMIAEFALPLSTRPEGSDAPADKDSKTPLTPQQAIERFSTWRSEQFDSWLGQFQKLLESQSFRYSAVLHKLAESLDDLAQYSQGSYAQVDLSGSVLDSIRSRFRDDANLILEPRLRAAWGDVHPNEDFRTTWPWVRLESWQAEIRHIHDLPEYNTNSEEVPDRLAEVAKVLEKELIEEQNESANTQLKGTFGEWLAGEVARERQEQEEAEAATARFQNWIIARLRQLSAWSSGTEYYAERLHPNNLNTTVGFPFRVREGLQRCHELMHDIVQKCKEGNLGEIPYKKIIDTVDTTLDAYWNLLTDVRDKYKNREIRQKFANYYLYTHYANNSAYVWVELKPLLVCNKNNAKALAGSLMSLLNPGVKEGKIKQGDLDKLKEWFDRTQAKIQDCIAAVDGK